ncbi:MAG: hypothetical protein LBP75_05870 [Planctomycetota bacterium]|jgi:hypothetical protein|nr:hypothetical protein [Planctomycetota bacterium]
MYEIYVKKRALKNLRKAPPFVQDLFAELVADLRAAGAIQPAWSNFSKLTANKYHCHLNYSYVACWQHENNSIKIEVYYAGSRENAPY